MATPRLATRGRRPRRDREEVASVKRRNRCERSVVKGVTVANTSASALDSESGIGRGGGRGPLLAVRRSLLAVHSEAAARCMKSTVDFAASPAVSHTSAIIFDASVDNGARHFSSGSQTPSPAALGFLARPHPTLHDLTLHHPYDTLLDMPLDSYVCSENVYLLIFHSAYPCSTRFSVVGSRPPRQSPFRP